MRDKEKLLETPFVVSLKVGQGNGFINRLMPILKRHQKNYMPQCASASRSPLLLRNTFNLDVYNEFVRRKKEMRNQFKLEYEARQQEV